jgi:membrane-associated phospholipid phosphatase
MYDAVNGLTRTHAPFHVAGRGPTAASTGAASTAAAHRVLTALFPENRPAFDRLRTTLLGRIAEGHRKRTGESWGQMVAERILQWRSADNWDASLTPPAGNEPGFWVPTPPAFAPYLLPHWGWVVPFAIPSGDFFRPPGPPALTSAEYTEEFNQVKAFGPAVNSIRTADQDVIALFWADGAGTETPPGHWNRIARDVAAAEGNTVLQNARLFALLNIAMADAGIGAWDAKHAYMYWRPITAIREGARDGNPATDPDPSWLPSIATPPFPDYVSGHSAFSGAAAPVLAHFYGTDDVPFTTGSDVFPQSRPFNRFSDAAREAALSRMYGGIHFASAIEDGLTMGAAIGEWTATRLLRPRTARSRERT